MILTVMLKADRPRKRREVTTGVRIEAGFEEEAEDGLRPHVRANLLYLTKVRGLLLKDGDSGIIEHPPQAKEAPAA